MTEKILIFNKNHNYRSFGKTCKLQLSEICCLHFGMEHTARCFFIKGIITDFIREINK